MAMSLVPYSSRDSREVVLYVQNALLTVLRGSAELELLHVLPKRDDGLYVVQC